MMDLLVTDLNDDSGSPDGCSGTAEYDFESNLAAVRVQLMAAMARRQVEEDNFAAGRVPTVGLSHKKKLIINNKLINKSINS